MIGQIPIFILDRPPEAFNKNVIKDSASTIHANLYARRLESGRERSARKLTALITVKNLWTPVTKGLLQRLQTEGRVLGVQHHPH